MGAGDGGEASSGQVGQPPEPVGPSRVGARSWAAPLSVFLLALSIRLAWGCWVEPATRRGFAWDATLYDGHAWTILNGYGFRWLTGEPTAYMLPGYPYLLALAYRLFGSDIIVAVLLNALLGSLTSLFTWGAAARAYGRRAGLAAGLLMAASPGDVFYTATTLSEPAFVCTFTGGLWAFLAWRGSANRRRSLRWIAIGGLAGAAALVRGVALLLPAVFVVAWLFDAVPRTEVARRTALLALGAACVISPWTLRNWKVMGEPILLSTGSGFVLFNSHSPLANGTRPAGLPAFREQTFPDLVQLPRREFEVRLSAAQTRYALRYALNNPGRELALALRRVYHLHTHDHAALRYVAGPRAWLDAGPGRVADLLRWKQRASRVADVGYFALAGLGLVGFAISWGGRWRHGRVIPLAVVYFHAVHALFFLGLPRYHAPLVPLWAMLAGLLVARFPARWCSRPDTTEVARQSGSSLTSTSAGSRPTS